MSRNEGTLRERLHDVEAQISALEQIRGELEQSLITELGGFAVGTVIKWEKCQGRVIARNFWVSRRGDSIQYRVVVIKKDGTEGATRNVGPYQNPVLA